MRYFAYGKAEIDHLSKADPRLGSVIARVGRINRGIEPDPFKALISSIISQQISGKAAAAVWQRLQERSGSISPQTLQNIPIEDLQACGMSRRKAEYIKGVTEAALEKTIDFSRLHELSDKEVAAKLTTLRGVGLWTAEMVLIFSLERPNILSWADLGIRKGIQRLHQLEALSKEDFEVYRARYSPYCSTASLYLWEIAGNPELIEEL